MSDFDDLIGKKVVSVLMNDDKTTLKFILDDETAIGFSAEGDCCSNSWFQSMSGISNLLNQVVNDVEVKDSFEIDESSPQYNETTDRESECIQIYGFTLKTAKGYTDIEMRNSSNGYYGGYVTNETEFAETMKPTGDF